MKNLFKKIGVFCLSVFALLSTGISVASSTNVQALRDDDLVSFNNDNRAMTYDYAPDNEDLIIFLMSDEVENAFGFEPLIESPYGQLRLRHDIYVDYYWDFDYVFANSVQNIVDSISNMGILDGCWLTFEDNNNFQIYLPYINTNEFSYISIFKYFAVVLDAYDYEDIENSYYFYLIPKRYNFIEISYYYTQFEHIGAVPAVSSCAGRFESVESGLPINFDVLVEGINDIFVSNSRIFSPRVDDTYLFEADRGNGRSNFLPIYTYTSGIDPYITENPIVERLVFGVSNIEELFIEPYALDLYYILHEDFYADCQDLPYIEYVDCICGANSLERASLYLDFASMLDSSFEQGTYCSLPQAIEWAQGTGIKSDVTYFSATKIVQSCNLSDKTFNLYDSYISRIEDNWCGIYIDVSYNYTVTISDPSVATYDQYIHNLTLLKEGVINITISFDYEVYLDRYDGELNTESGLYSHEGLFAPVSFDLIVCDSIITKADIPNYFILKCVTNGKSILPLAWSPKFITFGKTSKSWWDGYTTVGEVVYYNTAEKYLTIQGTAYLNITDSYKAYFTSFHGFSFNYWLVISDVVKLHVMACYGGGAYSLGKYVSFTIHYPDGDYTIKSSTAMGEDYEFDTRLPKYENFKDTIGITIKIYTSGTFKDVIATSSGSFCMNDMYYANPDNSTARAIQEGFAELTRTRLELEKYKTGTISAPTKDLAWGTTQIAADNLRKYSIINSGDGPKFTHIDMNLEDTAFITAAIETSNDEKTVTVKEYIDGKYNCTKNLVVENDGFAYVDTSTFYYANFGSIYSLEVIVGDQVTSTLTLNGYEYIYLGLKQSTDRFVKNVLVALYNFAKACEAAK